MQRYLFIILLCIGLWSTLPGQMVVDGDTLYGNEWINYDQRYFKINITEDAIYQINGATLAANGFPISEVTANDIQLFWMGKEQPVYISTEGTLGPEDFIEFHGKKNRGELDQFLYKNAQTEMLNPEYSLFSDLSSYFLTWSNGTHVRFVNSVVENVTDTLSNYEHIEVVNFHGQSVKNRNGSDLYLSTFEEGDGYGSSFVKTRTVNIPFSEKVQNDSNLLKVSWKIASDINQHDLEIQINNQQVFDSAFWGFHLLRNTINFNHEATSGNLAVTVSGKQDVVTDRYSIGNLNVGYLRQLNFGKAHYQQIFLQATDQTIVSILAFSNNSPDCFVLDLINNYRIQGTLVDNQLQFSLPHRSKKGPIVFYNSKLGVRKINKIEEKTFERLSVDADFIIISHPRLMDTLEGKNWIDEYKNYRSGDTGGGFKVAVININELYEQYSYGIESHPLSIRHFANWLKKKNNISRTFFIIGKGREYIHIRTNKGISTNFLIPTFGSPGADNLLFAKNVNTNHAQYPIGRLAATSPKEVRDYLQKVRLFEQNQSESPQTVSGREWMKKVIHLNGGDLSIQSIIINHLNKIGDILSENLFDANIFNYYKTNTEPIQSAQSEELIKQIDEGVALVTFFGHSGAVDFDFSIGQPSDYHNQGKTPLIIGLGCNSGNIHTANQGISEEFVLEPEVGALAFLAGSSFGVISSLQSTSDAFYQSLGKFYGKSLGVVLMEANKSLDRQNLNFFLKSGVQQFTLHGDPAVRLGIAEGPDFVVDDKKVRLSPSTISQNTDSINVSYQIVNLGSGYEDSIQIKFLLILVDNSEIEIIRKVPVLGSRFEYTSTITLNRAIPPGLTKLFITLDPFDEIVESPELAAENNNGYLNDDGSDYLSFLVFSNEVLPVSPARYSIWNEEVPITLRATTSDLFQMPSNFYFELDTIPDFDSPFKKSNTLRSKGGIIDWTPEIEWKDTVVYYWRISPDTTGNFGKYVWKNSSFIYLPNSEPGWNQSEVGQFRDNYLDNIIYNSQKENLEYITNINEIRIKNAVYPQIHPDVVYNNFSNFYLPWHKEADVGVYVVVFDPITLEPWGNTVPGIHGSWLPQWAADWYVFPYNTNLSAPRFDLINLLDTIIPDNYFVLLYTAQRDSKTYKPEEWEADRDTLGTNLFEILENTGQAQLIRKTINKPSPYVLFYQKNNPDFTSLEYLVDSGEIIDVTIPLPAFWDEGTLITPVIGPSKSWNRVEFAFMDFLPEETFNLAVHGISVSGDTTVLAQTDSIHSIDLSTIDAKFYPQIFVQIFIADELQRTLPELDYLRIFYEGLPDLTINSANYFNFYRDTLDQGTYVNIQTTIENTQSGVFVDSTLVQVTIINSENVIIEQQLVDLSFNNTSSTLLSWHYPGLLTPGNYSLLIEVDPYDHLAERFEQNNVGIIKFYVRENLISPLLDVTFDGRHIGSGAIVSANPEIKILIKDSHRYILFDEYSQVELFIWDPLGNIVILESDEVEFTPAFSLEKNIATVAINKEFNQSGKYKMTVEATSKTGLSTGLYQIEFEVVHQSTISKVISFPNPLTSQTRFIAIITGKRVPDKFEINIYSASGNLVKTFKKEHLNVHVGRFVSEYVWDGTDENGTHLPNGIYFYEVNTSDKEINYDQNLQQQHIFNRQGLGKIVILR